MAKSKKSGKKSKTTKVTVKEEKLPKEAVEVVEEVEETEIVETEAKEAEEKKKEKVVSETTTKKAEKEEKKKNEGFCKRFFRKKYDEQESILTIFKDHKIYGSLLGELFGTMIIAAVIFTLGLTQPLYMFFALLAVVIAVYKLSGAQLNPINTVGMMATRRMSAIRGVLYLLAQVVGAWLGYLVVKLFVNASAGLTGAEPEFPSMAVIQDGFYWVVTLLEFFGAAIVGFFFSRAQQFKENQVAFGTIVAGGMTVAIIVVYLISYAYFGLSGNFMLNPAVSLMYGILPSSAEGLGELFLGIWSALFTYVLFPLVGGILGFWLSDLADTFAEEKE